MDRPTLTIPFLNLAPANRGLEEDAVAVFRRLFTNNQYILGEDVRLFEEEFARLHGTAFAVGISSGTAALELILRALGVGPGDEVITTPFTFYATAAAIAFAGATPRFVDVDPATLNLDPDRLEEAKTAKTRAVLPVHLFGMPADMDRISAVARRHGWLVIEDACQAHLAGWGGRSVGGLGNAAAFSFYPTKNLGGFGDGGMATTDDGALAEKLRRLRNCGRPPGSTGARPQYEHLELGFNERLDSLQAALLRLKLPMLSAWTEERRRLADLYRQHLKGCPAEPLAGPAAATGVYHLFTVRAPRRDALKNYLAENGVASAVFYPIPLHLQPAFAGLGGKPGDCPEAEKAAGEVLSLPLYPGLAPEAVVRIAGLVRAFYQ